jgi:hypothetical protein
MTVLVRLIKLAAEEMGRVVGTKPQLSLLMCQEQSASCAVSACRACGRLQGGVSVSQL